MVYLTQLWLPILLSAVFVFVASSIIHMALGYHRSDYRRMPNEDKVSEALRGAGVGPGYYPFPYCDPKEMGSPEQMEKYKRGPVGFLTVIPSGPPVMAKFLTQWFLVCLVTSFVVAYLTGRALGPGTPYLAVFRIAGTAALLGYAGAVASESIWKGQSWVTTAKFLFDGLVYALLTAGTFGWLWPR
jgi:hypothetical protein